MSEKVPDRETAAAREGTLAHALGELEVRLAFGQVEASAYEAELEAWTEEVKAEGYSADTVREMEAHISEYVSFVLRRSELYPDTIVFVERRVDTGVPRSWGTSDVILVSPTHVEIVDLKYGAGVPVSALRNPQLRLYALGALDEYGDLLGEVDEVYASVFQPRLDSVSTERLTADQLRFWRDEVVVPAAYEALGDDPRFGPSESACRFCPAAGICRARANYITSKEFGDDPDTLRPEEVGDWLKRFSDLRKWIASVEAEALDAIYDRGEEIPGWKAVLSGGRRQVADPREAIERLEAVGYNREDVATEKLVGFGVLDRLVGKEELPEILGPILTKSSGSPSLAPESDRRESVTKLDDFDEI